MRLIFWLCTFLLFQTTVQSQLLINEVCSKNESLISDPGGFTPDFIEILNITLEDVQLDDYFLSDKGDTPFEWQLPEAELEGGEVIIIWCEGGVSSNFHTSFRIDSDGESVFLANEDGVAIDQVEVPSLRPDHSYGRSLDATEWGYFDKPTPGDHNVTIQYQGYSIPPAFSHEQGFYDEAFELQVNGEELLYTIGGANPIISGIPIGDFIPVDSTQVVKAVSLDPGFLPSEIVTNTYFIDVDKYLPVFSITSEPDDLWGQDSGIYVMGNDADTIWPYWGANWWDGRQIKTNVEFFKDNELVFEQGADMRMHGGKSARNKPQKPLRIIGRKEFGEKYFHHQLIEQKPNHQYKKFVLRNSGGDFNQLHFRDCWIHMMTLDAGLNLDVNGCEPAVVYLNGQYWGVQNIREKVDKYYCRFNGGYDEDVTYTILEEDTIILEGNRVQFNEMLRFFQIKDLSNPLHFAQADSMLDIKSMTDYIIVETFWNNTDWPANNQKYWKPNVEGGKWRFVLFDLDVSLNSVGYVTVETNNLMRITQDFEHIELISLWTNLLENDEYRRYFINRYADLLNTCYEPEFLEAELIDFLIRMEPEMEHNFAKWGNTIGWWWAYHINPRTRAFVQERTPIARTQVNSVFKLAGIYNLEIDSWPRGAGSFELNTLELDEPFWSGEYYKDVAIDLQAKAIDGFRFSHWRTGEGERIEGEQLQMAFNQDTQLTAVYRAEMDFNLAITPNPNQGSFGLEFLNDTYLHTVINVLDLQGRVVYDADLGLMPPGVHSFQYHFNLSAGLYHVTVKRGIRVDSRKFVVY